MEPSPLTQQARPEVFQQKVVQLYEELFRSDDDEEQSEGFWREFFLLKPDRASLRKILADLSPDYLLHYPQSRELFTRAIVCLRSGTRGDADLHALETLSTFLISVLGKKYTNPSSDVINVLVGLEDVDTVFTDFVGSLDAIIRTGRSLELRQKAVEVVLAITSGAYQTTLLTYLIQRDLFMGIMKFIHESDAPSRAVEAFILLGLLANYNKFEFQNPYQMRLSDFVNESTIKTIIGCIGYACQELRAKYVDVQDDISEAWTLSNTLSMIGLGSIAPSKAPQKVAHDPETAKKMFSQLPSEQAAVLLSTYDFAHVNKLFCSNFITSPVPKGEEHPFAAYISLTSYILTHAHLSHRSTHYAHLNLMTFRLLIEDPALCKTICSTSSAPVRLCRQRQPHLPLAKTEDRVLACSLLDLMVDGINHNLRRRLDVGLYALCVGILLRIISYLSRTRTRLQYHWSELWKSLLSFIRFLTTYVNDLKSLNQMETLLDLVVNLVALSLSAGESFLPGPAAYDDLFYKTVETHDVLLKFREAYSLGKRPNNSISTLIGVGEHYRRILEESGGKRGKLDTRQMADVIKKGYETLSIQTKEGLDGWEKFREADERILLKKVARDAVHDVRSLVV